MLRILAGNPDSRDRTAGQRRDSAAVPPVHATILPTIGVSAGIAMLVLLGHIEQDPGCDYGTPDRKCPDLSLLLFLSLCY